MAFASVPIDLEMTKSVRTPRYPLTPERISVAISYGISIRILYRTGNSIGVVIRSFDPKG